MAKNSESANPRATGTPDDQTSAPSIEEFLHGEPAAVRRMESTIARAVRRRGSWIPEPDRRDLVQQTLLDLCQAVSKPGFILKRDLAVLARSIAYKRCVDWVRGHRQIESVDPSIPAAGRSAEEIILDNERRALVVRALGEIGETCKELFRLHAGEGLHWQEISERLGRSSGALRTQMWECLRALRRIILRLERPLLGSLDQRTP